MNADGVHRSARGYQQVAGVYDRARPTYPTAAVQCLLSTLNIGPESRVLDLGAGTGKLTAALAASGAALTAIEPIPRMLDQLRRRLPDVDAHRGTAEAIPLPEAAVDAVTVAQAFHWFDPVAALAEISRVLGVGGGLALIWNRRDDSDPLWKHINALLQPLRSGTPVHGDDAWRTAFDATDSFGPLSTWQFRNEHIIDRDLLVGRVASISFVASLKDQQRRELLADVRRIPDQLGLPTRFSLRYTTELHTTHAVETW